MTADRPHTCSEARGPTGPQHSRENDIIPVCTNAVDHAHPWGQPPERCQGRPGPAPFQRCRRRQSPPCASLRRSRSPGWDGRGGCCGRGTHAARCTCPPGARPAGWPYESARHCNQNATPGDVMCAMYVQCSQPYWSTSCRFSDLMCRKGDLETDFQGACDYVLGALVDPCMSNMKSRWRRNVVGEWK